MGRKKSYVEIRRHSLENLFWGIVLIVVGFTLFISLFQLMGMIIICDFDGTLFGLLFFTGLVSACITIIAGYEMATRTKKERYHVKGQG